MKTLDQLFIFSVAILSALVWKMGYEEEIIGAAIYALLNDTHKKYDSK